MSKAVSILGSTGSIGTQALDVIRKCGYTVSALTACTDIQTLEKQIREFLPPVAAVYDERAAAELKIRVADTPTLVLSGEEGVCRCAAEDSADIVLNAIVGIAGLKPTVTAINCKKDIALANKETLVAGGHLVTNAAKENGVKIYPVDSEHSAIFQCLQGAPSKRALKKIILTASGGPFFGKSRSELKNVTIEQALKHPNWSMGAKITIDSATMVNKGLELIEAVWLFDMPPEKIDILVHRESIVHSMIEYEDNSVIAQLGLPDMRIPIQYALTYPERIASPVGELSLADVGTLSFAKVDSSVFEGIKICKNAIERGGLYPAAVNSANEEANFLFRQGKIGFLDISRLAAEASEAVGRAGDYTLDDVFETDKMAREFVRNQIS